MTGYESNISAYVGKNLVVVSLLHHLCVHMCTFWPFLLLREQMQLFLWHLLYYI